MPIHPCFNFVFDLWKDILQAHGPTNKANLRDLKAATGL